MFSLRSNPFQGKLFTSLGHTFPKTIISHIEFTEHYQNVMIICHVESEGSLTKSSVKVHRCYSVRFEHLTVNHSSFDVTQGGSAHLHMCNVGPDPPQDPSQMDSLPTFLECWKSHYNLQSAPYSAGIVAFQECSLSASVKGKWRPSKKPLCQV